MTVASDMDSSIFLDHWEETWNGFNRAIRSTEEFFAFRWTWRLLVAGLGYLYVQSGLIKLRVHVYWRSWVPSFAVLLVVLVVASYYTSLRTPIMERWQCAPPTGNGGGTRHPYCLWPQFLDVTVAYLGVMVLFHYLSACFRSSGVALSQDYEQLDVNAPQDERMPSTLRWTALDSRGGCCCMDPIFNLGRERTIVELYKSEETGYAKHKSCHQHTCFPSPEESRCDKCNIQRPPRCHHCSICNRCILQFDHHCVWLNNCVGYNNYRNFLMTLFYLTIGCWYGIALLFFPFYEPLKQQWNEKGWRLFYETQTGFLDLPPLTQIVADMLSGSLDNQVVIKLVFPLLAAVGLIQTVFLYQHVNYVISALTTLEYKILLDMQYNQLLDGNSTFERPINPFDQGWYQNFRAALGRAPLLLLLPVPVASTVLKTPNKNDKKKS